MYKWHFAAEGIWQFSKGKEGDWNS